MPTALQRIVAVFRRRHLDERLDEEVQGHLDLLAAEYERRGLTSPPSYVAASLVSGTYFDVLGVTPKAGRLLTASDDRLVGPDAPCAAVISDALWSRRFARNQRGLGSVIRARDRDCAIVGVAPAAFTSGSGIDDAVS